MARLIKQYGNAMNILIYQFYTFIDNALGIKQIAMGSCVLSITLEHRHRVVYIPNG